MRTTDVAVCEQVVLAWSQSNLLGNSGIGPVAASSGWKLTPNDPLAGLGESGRYLPEGVASVMVSEGVRPPVALEYRPDPDGTLLIAKVYAARSQRAGHYQVHALRDAAGACSPWDLWAARDAGVLFADEVTDELALTLPQVSLRRTAAPAPAGDDLDAGPLRVLLERLLADRVFTIRSSDQGAAEEFARRLLAYLPWRVTLGIPITTLAAEPSPLRRGIALVISPFSRGFDAVDVDLDAARLVDGGDATADLADLLLRGRRAEADALGSLGELKAWLALRRSDLAALSGTDLEAACQPSLFPTFLARLAGDARRGDVLLRLSDDPRAGRAFTSSLGARAWEDADLVAALFADSGLERARNARVQDWLVDAVGADAFGKHVLRPLLVEAERRPIVVDGQALAEVLADRLSNRTELADFTFRTTTPTWTSLTDFQVQSHLTGGEALPDGVRALIRRNPPRLAAAIDQLLAGRRSDAGVREALLAWPDDDLEALIEAVLASRRLDESWAVRVLERKPARVVTAVLTKYWPRIAKHLGIPESVTQRLEVKKQRWWSLD